MIPKYSKAVLVLTAGLVVAPPSATVLSGAQITQGSRATHVALWAR